MGALKAQQQAQQDALRLQRDSAQQAAAVQAQLASKATPTQDDNFVSNKLRSLSQLRLGLASTITAPQLAQMKTHLG